MGQTAGHAGKSSLTPEASSPQWTARGVGRGSFAGAPRQTQAQAGHGVRQPWQTPYTNPARPPGFPDHPEAPPRTHSRGKTGLTWALAGTGPGTHLAPAPQLSLHRQAALGTLPSQPRSPTVSPGGAPRPAPPTHRDPRTQVAYSLREIQTQVPPPAAMDTGLSPHAGQACGPGGLGPLFLPP